MQSARPKIAIKKSSNDKVLEILMFGTLAGCWLIALLRFHSLPEQIPIHFDGSGAINGWGSKSGIFVLPAIATIVAIIIYFIRLHPEWHNYPVKITPENAKALYSSSSQFLSWINYIIILLFFVVENIILDAARNQAVPGYFNIIWILIAALVIIPIIQIIRLFKLR